MAGPTVRPAATAPQLTPAELLSEAWRLAQGLPEREREELHRRVTATLPVVVTAEPVSLECSALQPVPVPVPYLERLDSLTDHRCQSDAVLRAAVGQRSTTVSTCAES
jgi:hypothetical protein